MILHAACNLLSDYLEYFVEFLALLCELKFSRSIVRGRTANYISDFQQSVNL